MISLLIFMHFNLIFPFGDGALTSHSRCYVSLWWQ